MFFAREWLVLGTLILVYRAIVWRIGFESKGLLQGRFAIRMIQIFAGLGNFFSSDRLLSSRLVPSCQDD
jgi:hypothetical protein